MPKTLPDISHSLEANGGDVSTCGVVILAGGKGTRLRPYTATFPKPLVPVGDMPILERLLLRLRALGFRDVTITTGHLGALIGAFVSQSEQLAKHMRIRILQEETPTGTAGSIVNIENLPDVFLVMNGDVLTDLDFRDLVRAHKETESTLTIASHKKCVKIDLGVLRSDEDNNLTHYDEKPVNSYAVSMGIYVYSKRAVEFIKPGEYLDFPDLVHRLLQANERVQVYPNDAFWLDIGRPDDYATAQEIVAADPCRFTS